MTPHRTAWGPTVVAVVAAAALVAGLRAALARDPASTGWEFFPDMARSAAWASQTDGAPTADGLADRPLVAGVVPRGALPFRYGDGPDEAARAGRELTNPFRDDDAAAAARGAEVYARFCSVCHGADGEGEGPAVRRGMTRPPSLRADRAVALPDGALFHVLARGQGNMASYAAPVPPDDRWRAILHVRRLQKGAAR